MGEPQVIQGVNLPAHAFIPARVEVALRFVQTLGSLGTTGNKSEDATLKAALELLTNYFKGEMDFGDVPVQKRIDDPPPSNGIMVCPR